MPYEEASFQECKREKWYLCVVRERQDFSVAESDRKLLGCSSSIGVTRVRAEGEVGEDERLGGMRDAREVLLGRQKGYVCPLATF